MSGNPRRLQSEHEGALNEPPGETPSIRVPSRVEALRLPERVSLIGSSVRDADVELLSAVHPETLDTTHFDVQRFPPPEWARHELMRALSDGANAYTPFRGQPDVLEAVATSLSDFLGVSVDPDRELVLTPGTQGGAYATLAALVEPGDRVLLADPDYLYSERVLRYLGAHVDHLPLLDSSGRLELDLDALEQALKGNPRLLLFSHPNNPTGAVFAPQTIARIAGLLLGTDTIAVVDELYARLIYDDVAYTHLATEPGMRGRCVTLLGPSKTESLTGFRIGVVVAPPPIADGIEDVLSITSLRAPAYAQQLLRPWLRDDHDWVAERVLTLRALRGHTVARLSDLSWMRVQPQPATAYLFPDASTLGLSDRVVAHELLEQANVLVSPGYQFGPRGVGSFRICYARDEQQWDIALDRIVHTLAALRDQSRADAR